MVFSSTERVRKRSVLTMWELLTSWGLVTCIDSIPYVVMLVKTELHVMGPMPGVEGNEDRIWELMEGSVVNIADSWSSAAQSKSGKNWLHKWKFLTILLHALTYPHMSLCYKNWATCDEGDAPLRGGIQALVENLIVESAGSSGSSAAQSMSENECAGHVVATDQFI